jgi:hypothetical protein
VDLRKAIAETTPELTDMTRIATCGRFRSEELSEELRGKPSHSAPRVSSTAA